MSETGQYPFFGLDDLTALDWEWDGRCFGSVVRDSGWTPLGGYIFFWCGCEWRTNGHRNPCNTHVERLWQR